MQRILGAGGGGGGERRDDPNSSNFDIFQKIYNGSIF
jgi:hypothetical protein